MFTIELTLKYTALPLSVQKKTAEEAESTYRSVVESMKSGSPVLLELVCDQQPGKKVTAMVSEIAAVQMFEKSSTATASGRPPGFFAMTAE